MHTSYRSIALLFLLLTISLSTSTPTYADPRTVAADTQLSETLVLRATTWAPRGQMDSTTACELAKEQALQHLGVRAKELQLVARTGTTSFPSHLTCQWDPARHAYQVILSMEIPDTHAIRTLTADRLY